MPHENTRFVFKYLMRVALIRESWVERHQPVPDVAGTGLETHPKGLVATTVVA